MQNPRRFERSETISFTIVVVNNVPGSASDVQVKDTIAPSVPFTLTMFGGTGGTICLVSGQTITCAPHYPLTLAPGGTYTLVIIVQMGTSTPFQNYASLPPGSDSNPANNQGCVTLQPPSTVTPAPGRHGAGAIVQPPTRSSRSPTRADRLATNHLRLHASPHKTHEEAWFLLQTRWMLYLEEGNTLKLLRGIPRGWLESGQRVGLERVASYFGPLWLTVESDLCHDRIVAEIVCEGERRPAVVDIRLPHPQGRRPEWVRGAIYDPAKETARITGFSGRGQVVLGF